MKPSQSRPAGGGRVPMTQGPTCSPGRYQHLEPESAQRPRMCRATPRREGGSSRISRTAPTAPTVRSRERSVEDSIGVFEPVPGELEPGDLAEGDRGRPELGAGDLASLEEVKVLHGGRVEHDVAHTGAARADVDAEEALAVAFEGGRDGRQRLV